MQFYKRTIYQLWERLCFGWRSKMGPKSISFWWYRCCHVNFMYRFHIWRMASVSSCFCLNISQTREKQYVTIDLINQLHQTSSHVNWFTRWRCRSNLQLSSFCCRILHYLYYCHCLFYGQYFCRFCDCHISKWRWTRI